jgi:hypothetical protein
MSADNERFLRELVGNLEAPLNYAANELWQACEILDELIELEANWDHKRFSDLVQKAIALRSPPKAKG